MGVAKIDWCNNCSSRSIVMLLKFSVRIMLVEWTRRRRNYYLLTWCLPPRAAHMAIHNPRISAVDNAIICMLPASGTEPVDVKARIEDPSLVQSCSWHDQSYLSVPVLKRCSGKLA